MGFVHNFDFGFPKFKLAKACIYRDFGVCLFMFNLKKILFMNEKLKNGLTMRSCSAGAGVKNFFNALFKAIKSLCKEAFEIRNVIAMTAIALVASIPLFLLMVWMTEVLTEGGTQLYPATDALQAQLLLLLDTAEGFWPVIPR